MSNYVINLATAKDNEAICALCNIPLHGNIVLALERAPDFFAGSKIQSEEIETYTCRKKGSNGISGVFSVGKRRVFMQNQIKQVRYFSDLRIHPAAQGSRVVYEISRYINDNEILSGEVAQTIVFADNKPMLKLIERLSQHAKKMSLFRYFPAGNYHCYMVKFSQNRKVQKSYQIIRAENKHIPAMQRLLLDQGSRKEFFPYYQFDLAGNSFYSGLRIEHYYLAFQNDQLVGITGVWDQHAIKQTRIVKYMGYYKWLRPVINLYAAITGGFRLPAKGTILRYVAIHTILTKNNESQIFDGLLNQIHNDHRKMQYDYFLVGLDEKDNLNQSLDKFSNKRLIKGKHFLVADKENIDDNLSNSLYYMEAARI